MGGSFMPPVRLNPDGTQLAAADWQGPAIAAAGNNLWAVYKGLPEDTAPCYLVGSTDGGDTWGDTLRVDPYDGLVSRFPVVAARSDGSPVVEYMQFTSGYLEPRHVVRTWMGGSFMPPAQVSAPFAPGEVCDCCTGEVAASDYNVVALYRNAGGNIRTIWGASSGDGGMSFSTGAQVDATNWSLDACPSSGPDSYLTGDSIRYVWMSGEENGIKVYLGSAHAATLVVGSQQNVHPGQASTLQQNFPRIAGSGDTLGIVWEQSMNGGREILFAWSTTGVTGLSSPDTVNLDLTGQQRTPDIAYANGAFHMVWSEPAMGQVRYRKATVVSTTGVPEHAPPSAAVWPNPVHEVLNMADPRWTSAVASDLYGRIVQRWSIVAGAVPVSGLAPGTYQMTLSDHAGHQTTISIEKQ